jgi:hypothetical protein
MSERIHRYPAEHVPPLSEGRIRNTLHTQIRGIIASETISGLELAGGFINKQLLATFEVHGNKIYKSSKPHLALSFGKAIGTMDTANLDRILHDVMHTYGFDANRRTESTTREHSNNTTASDVELYYASDGLAFRRERIYPKETPEETIELRWEAVRLSKAQQKAAEQIHACAA